MNRRRRIYNIIHRNWFGLGWVVVLVFIVVHPPPGSPYFEFMFSLVTSFGAIAGAMVAVNHRALAERVRNTTVADRLRFRLPVRSTDTSLAFIRVWAACMALVASIGFIGGALGYVGDKLGAFMLVLGTMSGILITVDVSRGE